MMTVSQQLKGALITFSAIDGAGKSTQIEKLRAYLVENRCNPVCLWSRGGYTTGFILLKSWARRLAPGKLPASGPSAARDRYLGTKWIRKLWLTAAIIDLTRVYGLQIRWWRWRGRTVLCDRYLWDTLIDFQLAFPDVEVEKQIWWKLLVLLTPNPRKSFFLKITLETSIRRCQQKYDPFPDDPARRIERLACYERLSQRARWVEIDASGPAAGVFHEIVVQL